ncbi:hypothetical protein ACPV5T_10320 [Vibrio astriarenae]
MKAQKRYVIGTALLGALVLSACGSSSNNEQAQVVLDESYYSDIYNWNESKGLASSFLGRGINMGNFFESPNYEGEWNGDLTIQASDFANIANQGLPVFVSPCAGTRTRKKMRLSL